MRPFLTQIGRVVGARRAMQIIGPPDPAWSLPPDRALYVEPVSGETLEVKLPLLDADAEWVRRAAAELTLDDDVDRYMLDVWFDVRSFDADKPLAVMIGKDVIAAHWDDERACAMVTKFLALAPRKSAFSITGDLDAAAPAIHFYVPPQLL